MKINYLESKDFSSNLHHLNDGIYFFHDPENEFGSWNTMSHYVCIDGGCFVWSIDYGPGKVMTHYYDKLSKKPFLCEKDVFIKYISDHFSHYLGWVTFNLETL